MFQRQMEDLRDLRQQLDSAAETVDAATRGHYHTQHQQLTDTEHVIQQRASDRQQAIKCHIDSWQQFDGQWNDACSAVDAVEAKLSSCVDVTCDMAVLRQQAADCQDELESVRSHVSEVIELGHQLLEHVSSPNVVSQVNSLSDRIHSLTESTDTHTQRYYVSFFYDRAQ